MVTNKASVLLNLHANTLMIKQFVKCSIKVHGVSIKSYKNALVYPKYGQVVLEKFGLSESNLLGAGMHSRVYAIDAASVLRLYSPGISFLHVESIFNFYNELDASQVDFAVPEIREFDVYKDIVFSLERNLGQSMGSVFGFRRESQVSHLIEAYCAVVGEIKGLQVKEKNFYGELMGDEIIQRETWSQFLLDCAERKIESSIDDLRDNVLEFDQLYERWIAKVEQLPNPDPQLVHGDIFPGNLMIDETGRLSSVIDFSSMSLIGDWQFDVVIASIHIVFSDLSIEQMKFIQKDLDERYGVPEEIFDLYAMFNLMYFSPDNRPLQKQWCYENINKLVRKAAFAP